LFSEIQSNYDDDAFYLFLQKQKLALKPYTPPLGTSQLFYKPDDDLSRFSFEVATCASTVQRIRMCPTAPAPAPVNQGVTIVVGYEPLLLSPLRPLRR
jgi:hypothetical protein